MHTEFSTIENCAPDGGRRTASRGSHRRNEPAHRPGRVRDGPAGLPCPPPDGRSGRRRHCRETPPGRCRAGRGGRFGGARRDPGDHPDSGSRQGLPGGRSAVRRPGHRAELTLDQHDTLWLEGRPWGPAEGISEALSDGARCSRFVDALGRGRKRFTPLEVDALRRLAEEDLMLHREEPPGGFRTAYDAISRGLDTPARGTAPGPAPVRRTLAHRIQRDRLGGGNRAVPGAGPESSPVASPLPRSCCP